MLACRLLGHRYRFCAEGTTMRWACARCGGGSSKEYASPEDAARYARGLDREDRDEIGRRTPLGLLPLRSYAGSRSGAADKGEKLSERGARAAARSRARASVR